MKIDVIPNRLEKHITFFFKQKLSLYWQYAKLVKTLSDNDFKYLTQEFGSQNLELLKQTGAYPYEYVNSFKRFREKKLPDKECFCSSVKDGTTGNNGKKLDGCISDKEYLMWRKNLE